MRKTILAFAAASASAHALWAQEEEASDPRALSEQPAQDQSAGEAAQQDDSIRRSVLDAVRSLREGSGGEAEVEPQEGDDAGFSFLDADDLPDKLPIRPLEAPFEEGLRLRRIAMSDAEENERGAAALELARFYYSYALFEEAAAVVDYLSDIDFEASFDPAVQLLREAALVASGQLRGQATSALGFLSAVGQADAVMWSGVLAAREEDWRSAAFLGRSGGIDRVFDYAEDDPMRLVLGAIFAEALVQMQAFDAADRLIRRLEPEDLSDALPGRVYPDGPVALERARGILEEARDNFQAALTSYDTASAGRGYRAHDAKLRSISLRYELEIIDAEQAARELDALSYAWRGDDLEARTLFKLADVRFDAGRPDLALRPLAWAASRFSRSRVGDEARRRMLGAMRTIFVDELGPQDPVILIDLYERFRRALGDTDDWELIDNAYVRTLEDLRLKGEAYSVARRMEARTASRFRPSVYLLAAEQHLKNDRPRLALQAIDAAEVALAVEGGAENVEDARRVLGARGAILRARGQFQQREVDDAFATLQEDGSPEALDVLAGLAWQEARWTLASQALRDRRLAQDAEEPSSRDLARERLALFLSGEAAAPPPRPRSEPWRGVVESLFGPADPPLFDVTARARSQAEVGGAATEDVAPPPTGDPEEAARSALGVSPELLAQLDPELLAAVEADERARRRLSRLQRNRAEQGADAPQPDEGDAIVNDGLLLTADELEARLADVDALIDFGERVIGRDYPLDERDMAAETR